VTAAGPEGLARHRLARARDALVEARTLFEAGRFGGAINRFYYAAFHAARALLATKRLDSARHSGAIALFQQHFVKTGVISVDVARALPRAFEKRQNSDYEDFAEITAEEAGRVAVEVPAFVEECAKALERLLAQAAGPSADGDSLEGRSESG
jgi:uncharacterized protein (UPF0332 family)